MKRQTRAIVLTCFSCRCFTGRFAGCTDEGQANSVGCAEIPYESRFGGICWKFPRVLMAGLETAEWAVPGG
jgi:hypothetical protein